MLTNLIEAALIIKTLPVNEVIVLYELNSGLICYPTINQEKVKCKFPVNS